MWGNYFPVGNAEPKNTDDTKSRASFIVLRFAFKVQHSSGLTNISNGFLFTRIISRSR